MLKTLQVSRVPVLSGITAVCFIVVAAFALGPNPPITKPQPMILRSQTFVSEFEKQFLKEKNER